MTKAKAEKPTAFRRESSIVSCEFCDGTGKVKEKRTAIKPKAMPKHLAFHAYRHEINPETNRMSTTPIGANCDCPRETKIVERNCDRCGGVGKRTVWKDVK